ncbi:MAG: hypothetical protein Tsb0020_36750 [Haliangiales bacterium]
MRLANPVARSSVALSAALVALLALLHAEAHAQSSAADADAPTADATDAADTGDVEAEAGDLGDDPAASPTSAADSAADSAIADEPPAANLRLRRLEQRVQALKERAWRTKARVRMLEEKVLGGGVGANATIVHVDQMGSTYELVQLVYNLDGTQVFARKDDSGVLADDEELQVLAGPVSPGSHTVTVLAVYEGRGYGVFKYMNKYKFTVRSTHTFSATEGKATRIEARAHERGNLTTPVDQRPAIEFTVSYGQGGQGGATSDRKRDGKRDSRDRRASDADEVPDEVNDEVPDRGERAPARSAPSKPAAAERPPTRTEN